jgi:hypothetical protein
MYMHKPGVEFGGFDFEYGVNEDGSPNSLALEALGQAVFHWAIITAGQSGGGDVTALVVTEGGADYLIAQAAENGLERGKRLLEEGDSYSFMGTTRNHGVDDGRSHPTE